MAIKRHNDSRWKSLLTGGLVRQVLAIVGVSCVLGLAYNASNPIGVRWADPAAEWPQSKLTKVGTNMPLVGVPPQMALAKPASNANPVVIAASGTNSPVPVVPPQYVPPTGTTWAEIKPLHLQGKLVLVDARAKWAFEALRIPGAISLPEPPSTNEWAAFCARYATNSHIVVYCSSTNCSLSFRLAHRLAREGHYSFVQYMTGGFQDWQRTEHVAGGAAPAVVAAGTNPAKLPVKPRELVALNTPPVTPPIPAISTGQKMDNVLPLLWAQTKPLLGTGQAVLVDARPAAEFQAGHIPGAISLPSDAPAETIRQVLKGRDPKTRWVVYCRAMGSPQAFQLATRLLKEFDFANSQFLLEGYAEWRQMEGRTAGDGGSR